MQGFQFLTGMLIVLAVWQIGSGRALGWYLSVFAQSCWIAFVLIDGMWAMLPSALILAAVQIRGLLRWSKCQSTMKIQYGDPLITVGLSVAELSTTKSVLSKEPIIVIPALKP